MAHEIERKPLIIWFEEQSAFAETYGFAGSGGKIFLEGQLIVPKDRPADTLVVFMNDNGGTAGCDVFNAGMRGKKGTPFLGGTRASSFWRWPGTLKPADCDKLADGLNKALDDNAAGIAASTAYEKAHPDAEKKFDEAITVLHQAVDAKPEEKIYYRQLGAVYSKANNNTKSTELLMVYMAMSNGKPGDLKAAAGSPAENTRKAMGAPDKVLLWDANGQSLQTWMYLKAKKAFTFDAAKGTVVQKSDWATPVLTAPAKK